MRNKQEIRLALNTLHSVLAYYRAAAAQIGKGNYSFCQPHKKRGAHWLFCEIKMLDNAVCGVGVCFHIYGNSFLCICAVFLNKQQKIGANGV